MKKALLLASFGTMHQSGRAALIKVEEDLNYKLRGFEISQVFTSNFIRKKLYAAGICIESLEEALERLWNESYQHVFVLPTHLCTGKEYEEKIVETIYSFMPRFSVLSTGKPVLYFDSSGNVPNAESMLRFIFEILPSDFQPKTDQVVLIGHGVQGRENVMYHWLQKNISMKYPFITIGLLEAEDHFGLEGTLARVALTKKHKVHLIPFLLFRGNHVLEDIAGDKKTSWKSMFMQQGYKVAGQWKGLLEFRILQQFYVQQATVLVNSINI